MADRVLEAAKDAGYRAAIQYGNDARNPFPPGTPKHDAWWAGNAAYWGDEADADGLLEALGPDRDY